MRLPLIPHPDGPQLPVTIDVELSRSLEGVTILYAMSGNIGGIIIPQLKAPDRRDGLWQHTCFEMFVKRPGEEAYREFNFSPSSEWAAYAFEAYRQGMVPFDLPPPRIETRSGDGILELETTVEVPEGPLRLALSAVIEETGGRKSYWALAHPAAKPDFHHLDSFVCELPFSSPRT